MSWHTRIEKKAIKKFGGKPLEKYGFDGKIRGRPVEVRAVRKDDRFRIQRNVHKLLVAERGSYIFVDDDGSSKRIPAKEVSEMIGRKKWFEDRSYPHKFISKKQIFKQNSCC